MMAIRAERRAFWGWDRATWARTLRGANHHVRQHVIAVAYLLCGWRDLHRDLRGFRCGRFARHVFGPGPVDATLARVQDHLVGSGTPAVLQRPNLKAPCMS
jgi:hypothetical protein